PLTATLRASSRSSTRAGSTRARSSRPPNRASPEAVALRTTAAQGPIPQASRGRRHRTGRKFRRARRAPILSVDETRDPLALGPWIDRGRGRRRLAPDRRAPVRRDAIRRGIAHGEHPAGDRTARARKAPRGRARRFRRQSLLYAPALVPAERAYQGRRVPVRRRPAAGRGDWQARPR